MTGTPAPRAASRGSSVRSVNYATSPLLASKTPPWRSRFVVALVGAGLLRAARPRGATCRSSAPTSTSAQGEMRFARTLTLPASRGRILDRNGLILATSVAVPSLLGDPEGLRRRQRRSARELAKLLGMHAGRARRAARRRTRTSSGCKRQVDEPVGKQIACARAQGRAPGARVQAQVPRGRSRGARGGLHQRRRPRPGRHRARASRSELAGRDGSRRVIKDRLGRVVEDIGDSVDAGGRPRHPAVDRLARCSSSPTSACATRCPSTRPRPAAWWCSTCRPARCWRWPTTRAIDPGERRNLTRRAAAQPRADRHLRARLDDEALHRRAGAGKPAASRPSTPIQTAPGRITHRRLDRSATRTRTAC